MTVYAGYGKMLPPEAIAEIRLRGIIATMWPWNSLSTIHANQLIMLSMLQRILNKENTLMAAIDDLNAAVATLASNVTAFDTAVQAEIAALQAALAANNTPAIQAAATNIAAASTKLAADTAALTASLPSAP